MNERARQFSKTRRCSYRIWHKWGYRRCLLPATVGDPLCHVHARQRARQEAILDQEESELERQKEAGRE